MVEPGSVEGGLERDLERVGGGRGLELVDAVALADDGDAEHHEHGRGGGQHRGGPARHGAPRRTGRLGRPHRLLRRGRRGDRPQSELGGRGVEGARDPRPQAVGCVAALVGQERGDLTVLGDLGPAPGARRQVGLDRGALVGVDGVEGVGAEQLGDLVVGHALVAHGWPPTPASARPERRRRSPVRILVFTVPSGSSSIVATSR